VVAAQTLPTTFLAHQAIRLQQPHRKATTAAQAILMHHLMVVAAVELLRSAELAELEMAGLEVLARRLQFRVHR
jgi:hypothetical protein